MSGNGRPRGRSIAIVGGGLGGVAAGALLQRAGYTGYTVFEKGHRLGGVWNFNTYPGLACDIPSHLYEFSFAPNPRWSRRFSPGPEIQAYMEDVARREGVMEKVRLNTEVKSATFDEETGRWALETTGGPHKADFVIAACGQLSVPSMPKLPGLDSFAGRAFHTARWDHDVDLNGTRVAVVGTGCTAIQVVPSIQPIVAHLDVYQRSPGWTLPRMDFAYKERTKRLLERYPAIERLDRNLTQAFMEYTMRGMTGRHRWMLAPLRAAARRQINNAIKDPELRAKVTPTDEFGCKRMMLTDDWYRTLTEPNVDLVTDRIAEVTPGGIRTADGTERPADVLVLATGFKAHGFVAPMEISGRGGRTLSEVWRDVPRAYLGMTVPEFPNLFLMYGPNTNGGAGSVIGIHEAGMDHIVAALRAVERAGARTIEVKAATADAFQRELTKALGGSVWASGCSNWYVDEHGNNPNNWAWGWIEYRRRARAPLAAAYELRS